MSNTFKIYQILKIFFLANIILTKCISRSPSTTIDEISRSDPISSTTSTSTTSTKSTTSTETIIPRSSKIVKWSNSNGNFILDNKKFVPVGFNAYWLGLHEDYSYPTHSQIEEMFIVAQKLGANVIRSHTLGFSSGHPKTLRPHDNNLNNDAWEPIDYAFLMANKYNIKLITPLTDSYNYYHGNYGDFCKTRNLDKTQFWTDPDVRNDFKDYIYKWLNHVNMYTGIKIKDDSSLFLIELGNELGNIRPGATSTNGPTKDWLSDISAFIKKNDNIHLILNGVDESLGQNDDFNIDTLDVFSGHFYWRDYNRLTYGSSSSKAISKPYIIGEYNSHFEQDWFDHIESIKNVSGSVFWSMYPHYGGFGTNERMPHNDGYTLHYPENISELTRLSQHFSKMKTRT